MVHRGICGKRTPGSTGFDNKLICQLPSSSRFRLSQHKNFPFRESSCMPFTNHTTTLAAVLATPPLRTSGARTLGRLQLATNIIGIDSVTVANLLGVATRDVLDIAHVGQEAGPWLASREDLAAHLAGASAVLLAWGTTKPSGPARHHHQAQVAWVTNAIKTLGLPCWTVGGTPRHPSRWQRYTARTHPGVPFAAALAASIQLTEPGSLASPC